MQGQKKLSFSALALSVWTAALAESLEPGVSLRGMLLYGVLGALLLTGISAVLYVCWQQTAVRQVWLFAAVLGLLAEAFWTAMQAQSVCRQEFHSMAMLGLLPLLLWAGCRIPLSGWDAPARVWQALQARWSGPICWNRMRCSWPGCRVCRCTRSICSGPF